MRELVTYVVCPICGHPMRHVNRKWICTVCGHVQQTAGKRPRRTAAVAAV